jgi:hypothetical protein
MATLGVSPPDPADPLNHLTAEDRSLLFRFLGLIRDNYKKADKAAHFLERKAGVTNTCGITNLRDVLSHFATLLDPSTPQEKRRDQIGNAEEHLRRAIIEPYEIGLASLTEKFKPTYDTYREKVLPLRNTEGFRAAPDRAQVDGRLADIDESAEKGKSAKGKNLWDEEWEEGVSGLIDAFDRLADLHNEIEGWIFKHRQDHHGRHSIRMHYIAIIVGVVVSIAAGVVIARYTPLLEVTRSTPAQIQKPPNH